MVLDTTVAGSAANSYLAVDDADDFARADLGKHAKKWLSSTADEKVAALLRATRDVDDYVEHVDAQWSYDALGRPIQALLFPRAEDAISGTPFIPLSVARATYEQASYLMVNAGIIDDAASRRAQGLANFSNPDGTGGQLATDVNAGALAPRAQKLLARLSEGAVIATIVTT